MKLDPNDLAMAERVAVARAIETSPHGSHVALRPIHVFGSWVFYWAHVGGRTPMLWSDYSDRLPANPIIAPRIRRVGAAVRAALELVKR